METISASYARNNLAELLNKVSYGAETFVIEKMGKPVAALVRPDRVVVAKSAKIGTRPSLTAGTIKLPKGIDIEEIFELMKEPYDLDSVLGR